MESSDVVIVGAGHAGAQTAIMLRQLKFAGSIALVGEERDLPYERPPLSKEYLAGERPFDRIQIRAPQFWDERKVELHLGCHVGRVDAATRRIAFEDRQIEYGRLVWATGGTPRRLTCAGNQLAGLHTIRTRVDVDRLLIELPEVRRIVIIGGGYIGLEAAAMLRKLDKPVIVLEALDRVLARVAAEPLSRFYEAEHRAHGVDVRLGVLVDCIEGVNGKVTGVRLATGDVLDADMVIVAIGIAPAVEPLVQAGAKGGNGVHVDEFCRTSLPDVYAIGDCAAHVNAFAGGVRVRLESVQNAVDQANVVAHAIAGNLQPYKAVPWFWSNQYGLRLQTIGLSIGYDTTVVRGDPRARSFSVVYLRAGEVIALDCVNATKDYAQGRKLVETKATPSLDALADSSHPLKDISPLLTE